MSNTIHYIVGNMVLAAAGNNYSKEVIEATSKEIANDVASEVGKAIAKARSEGTLKADGYREKKDGSAILRVSAEYADKAFHPWVKLFYTVRKIESLLEAKGLCQFNGNAECGHYAMTMEAGPSIRNRIDAKLESVKAKLENPAKDKLQEAIEVAMKAEKAFVAENKTNSEELATK